MIQKWLRIDFAILFLTVLTIQTSSGLASTPSAVKIDFNSAPGTTEFLAVGRPSALKIVGKGAAPKGHLLWKSSSITGTLSVDLNSFDTGIALRNTHMKEKYLETGKYPQAMLTITQLALPEALMAKDFSQAQFPFEGTLKLHGTERPVKGTVKADRKGPNANITASFATRISDYGLGVPSFAGITVADDVTVTVVSTSTLVPQTGTEKK